MEVQKKNYYEQAYALHQTCPVVNAHLDLPAEIYARYQCGEREVIKHHFLEDFKSAGINVMVCSVFIETSNLPYRGLELTLKQISSFLDDIESVKDSVLLIRTKDDLKRAIAEDKIGLLLFLEGLDIITDDCSILRALYEMGVRGASLTWSRRNYLGEGTCRAREDIDIRGGLSRLGIKTIAMMEELHMFVDVSHLNDDGFFDIVKYARKPFIASHSNARSVYKNYRNLTDEQIKLLAKHKGVMGMNAYHGFIAKVGEAFAHPVDCLCEHIEYILALVGDNHVGFGLDLCDSYYDVIPLISSEQEKNDVLCGHAQLVEVTAKLLQHGVKKSSVKKIMGGNFIRFFEQVLE